jgi:phenylalanyl-tRNA synthetase beta chain
MGLVKTLAGVLGIALQVEQGKEPGFHPGRSARVLCGATPIGVVGEIHPDVSAAWDLVGRVIAGELSVSALGAAAGRRFVVPSVFPPVVFDLAFDVAARTAVARVIAVIGDAAGADLEDVTVFDVFSGPPLDPGRKSIAVRLTFRHAERTMADHEMVPVREAIAARVLADLGGKLRGG